MSGWLTLIGLLALYGLIGTLIGSAVKYIREYDDLRSEYTSQKATFKGDPDENGFGAGLFWLPIGFLMLIYHLMHVRWDKEERQLIRELGRQPSQTKQELRARLDSIRESERRELENTIARLEKHG